MMCFTIKAFWRLLSRIGTHAAAFWRTLFQSLGTRLSMSTADYPQTDSQTERVSRYWKTPCAALCGVAPDILPTDEFAPNDAVHASMGYNPLFLIEFRYPRVLLVPMDCRKSMSFDFVFGLLPDSAGNTSTCAA